MPTPLKLLTFKEANRRMKSGSEPIYCYTFQSYNFLDMDDHPPSLPINERNTMEHVQLTFTGDLKTGWEDPRIVNNWLNTYSGPGPYQDPNYPHDFYYLGVSPNSYYSDWVQICELDILSTDCMDEVNLWVPVEVNDQVLILLGYNWNNYTILQMNGNEILISPSVHDSTNESRSKLVYLNPAKKTNGKGMVDGAWKVFGGEGQPYLIWFHSGELDGEFIRKYLSENSID